VLKQVLALCVFMTVLSITVGGLSRGGGTFESSGQQAATPQDDDAGPWFRKRHAPASRIAAQGSSHVTLDRDADSHFYVTADINGRSIRMMVDSGASIIALTRADAEALGYQVDSLPAAGSANTAGGVVPIRPVTLDRVRVDGLEVAGVQAAVIDADMPTSLMGQSFLSRLNSVTVEGDRMTLR
jgi:aspartyl protease family protein